MMVFLICFSANAQSQEQAVNTRQSFEVVATFFKAIKSGDGEKAIDLIDSLVFWSQPGENRLSGTKKNKSEVLDLFGSFHELSAGTLKLTDIKTLCSELVS